VVPPGAPETGPGRPVPGAPGRHAATEAIGAPASASGTPGYGGRHSSEAVRRRISRPVGRIYSTESARTRPAGPDPVDEAGPAEFPAAPSPMPEPPPAPPAPPVPAAPPAPPEAVPQRPDPEMSGRFATHHRAVQQHAAHQHAVQQQRTERPSHSDAAGTMEG
jgi:hypothetical protein